MINLKEIEGIVALDSYVLDFCRGRFEDLMASDDIVVTTLAKKAGKLYKYSSPAESIDPQRKEALCVYLSSNWNHPNVVPPTEREISSVMNTEYISKPHFVYRSMVYYDHKDQVGIMLFRTELDHCEGDSFRRAVKNGTFVDIVYQTISISDWQSGNYVRVVDPSAGTDEWKNFPEASAEEMEKIRVYARLLDEGNPRYIPLIQQGLDLGIVEWKSSISIHPGTDTEKSHYLSLYLSPPVEGLGEEKCLFIESFMTKDFDGQEYLSVEFREGFTGFVELTHCQPLVRGGSSVSTGTARVENGKLIKADHVFHKYGSVANAIFGSNGMNDYSFYRLRNETDEEVFLHLIEQEAAGNAARRTHRTKRWWVNRFIHLPRWISKKTGKGEIPFQS